MDIVERLRGAPSEIGTMTQAIEHMREAADVIERLREHNKKMASVITDYCNEFIEEAPFYDEFWDALQQKETYNEHCGI